MDVDLKRIARALSLFSAKNNAASHTNFLFRHVYGATFASMGETNSEYEKRLQLVQSYVYYMSRDVTNLTTIIAKLQWMHELKHTGEMSAEMWMAFASSDIDVFHIELRSVYDYVAKYIACVALHTNNVPDRSFKKLVDWTQKNYPKAKESFGERLVSVINDCSWFPLIRSIRDENIHRGGFTIVFPEQERILFQTLGGGRADRKLIKSLPAVMYNENVVDFQRYAAMLLANTFTFMDDVGRAVADLYKAPDYHAALELELGGTDARITQLWLSELADHLSK